MREVSGKDEDTRKREKKRTRFFPLFSRSSSFSLGLSHTRCSLLVVFLSIAAPVHAQDATFGAAQSRASKAKARFDATFKKYSTRYFGVGFDWRYFKPQAMAERELDPPAGSNVGARRLMQLMPPTVGEI